MNFITTFIVTITIVVVTNLTDILDDASTIVGVLL